MIPTTGETPDDAATRDVRDIDGVTDVFSPAPTVGSVAQAVAALVAGASPDTGQVRVRTSSTGTEIATRVAVDRDAATPETARSVADALLAHAPTSGDVAITVQVSRIS